jgi:hypothetical protein
VRSGKLIYTWAATTGTSAVRYRNPGFNLTMTTSNYVVDGFAVNGTHNVTNTTPSSIATGVNPGTNLTWSITATFTVTKPNGNIITWTCARTKELMNTNDTNCYRGQGKSIVWSKAKVKFNGTASGTNALGNTYASLVTNVVRDWNCTPDASKPNRHPFVSGTVVYTASGKLPRTIDYGSGTCDKDATLTIGVNTYTFSLW